MKKKPAQTKMPKPKTSKTKSKSSQKKTPSQSYDLVLLFLHRIDPYSSKAVLNYFVLLYINVSIPLHLQAE